MNIRFTGEYRDTILDANGRRLSQTPARTNVVVFRAMDLIAGLLRNEQQFKGILYWAVGTGGQVENPPAEDALRRTRYLSKEIYRKLLDPEEDITYDGASRTITIRVIFGPNEALAPLNEFGLYGGDATSLPDSGYLINYAAHEVIDRQEGELLDRTMKLTLSSDDMLGNALDLVAGLLRNASDLGGIQYLAVGTGDPKWDQEAPAFENMTKSLKNEIFRLLLHRSRDLCYDSKTRTLETHQTIAYDEAVGQLRELGLFGGDASLKKDSGYLFQYQIHPVIDKNQPIQLNPVVEITLGPDAKIKVPKLIGLKIGQAISKLDQSKLNLGTIKKVEKDQQIDRIIGQEPSAGSLVAEGTEVDVEIAESVRVVVPDLIGLSLNETEHVLKNAGLKLSEEEPDVAESEAPEGSIVSQKPLPGAKVVKGTAIRIVLAKPIHVIVPVISGLTVDEGAVVLENAKLRLAEPPYEERGDTEPYGTILEQAPAAGESVPRFTAINVVVSGPHKVEVPDLTGKTTSEGSESLRKAAALLLQRLGRPPFPPGLSLGDQENIEGEKNIGKIIKQTPAAEQWGPLYGTVDVEVAVALSIEVPSLLGLTVAKARETLEKKGLVLGGTQSRPDIAKAKTIVDQKPDPGSKVPKGSKVDVVIAGAYLVKVPDLAKKNLVYAREITKSRGLELRNDPVSHPFPDQVWIKSQNPPAGKMVPLRSHIDVEFITEVPNVVGKQVNAGRQLLKKIGLKLQVASEKESTRPAGEILEQEPQAKEKVLLGSIVKVVLSKGLTFVAVPDVVGKQKTQAEAILKEKELGMTVVAEVESRKEIGTVLAQDPGAGEKVPKGTKVNVTLSKGPPLTVVPEITGLLAGEAEKILKEAGVGIKVAEKRESTKPEGTVLDQDPEANQKVPKGSTVQVVVSKGPAMVEVPNVINKSLLNAAKILKEKKLKISVSKKIESDRPEDTVLAQKPKPGEKAAEGSTVKVIVSKGPSTVAVPNVVGKLLNNAQKILKENGLNPEIGRQLESETAAGTVLRQNPKAKAKVSKGSAVRLDISKDKDTAKVTVPDIVGQHYRKAAEALENISLKLVAARTQISRKKSGTVLSQNPKSGTKVKKGTVVNVVIAKSLSRGTTIPIISFISKRR